MCVHTIGAHKFSAFKAEACLNTLFPAISATDLTSMATQLNGEKVEKTILGKNGWQFVKSTHFGDANLSEALGTAEISISLG